MLSHSLVEGEGRSLVPTLTDGTRLLQASLVGVLVDSFDNRPSHIEAPGFYLRVRFHRGWQPEVGRSSVLLQACSAPRCAKRSQSFR
jgi:hypothetical protein